LVDYVLFILIFVKFKQKLAYDSGTFQDIAQS